MVPEPKRMGADCATYSRHTYLQLQRILALAEGRLMALQTWIPQRFLGYNEPLYRRMQFLPIYIFEREFLMEFRWIENVSISNLKNYK
jgi:hypothetical protein